MFNQTSLWRKKNTGGSCQDEEGDWRLDRGVFEGGFAGHLGPADWLYIYIYIYLVGGPLVVWNMNFMFPYLGNNYIQIDFHMFQRGNHQPATTGINRNLVKTCKNQNPQSCFWTVQGWRWKRNLFFFHEEGWQGPNETKTWCKPLEAVIASRISLMRISWMSANTFSLPSLLYPCRKWW